MSEEAVCNDVVPEGVSGHLRCLWHCFVVGSGWDLGPYGPDLRFDDFITAWKLCLE